MKAVESMFGVAHGTGDHIEGCRLSEFLTLQKFPVPCTSPPAEALPPVLPPLPPASFPFILCYLPAVWDGLMPTPSASRAGATQRSTW